MASPDSLSFLQERTLSVPVEDGTLHIQVLQLSKQVRQAGRLCACANSL
jgi:hypothetical protein